MTQIGRRHSFENIKDWKPKNWKAWIENIQRPSHIESPQYSKHTKSLCRETYLFGFSHTVTIWYYGWFQFWRLSYLFQIFELFRAFSNFLSFSCFFNFSSLFRLFPRFRAFSGFSQLFELFQTFSTFSSFFRLLLYFWVFSSFFNILIISNALELFPTFLIDRAVN